MEEENLLEQLKYPVSILALPISIFTSIMGVLDHRMIVVGLGILVLLIAIWTDRQIYHKKK